MPARNTGAKKAPQKGAIQDPVKVDSKHYQVELDNDRVRVLRVRYGPNEKSVMHGHPSGVLICLTDFKAKFTLPAGKPVERQGKAGEIAWFAAEEHLPENIGDKAIELILVELKG